MDPNSLGMIRKYTYVHTFTFGRGFMTPRLKTTDQTWGQMMFPNYLDVMLVFNPVPFCIGCWLILALIKVRNPSHRNHGGFELFPSLEFSFLT